MTLDPMNFHDVPEDVAADATPPTEPIIVEPELDPARVEHAKLMLEAARKRSRTPQRMAQVQEHVEVSVAPDSGRIRKNGPCPCGSKKKFKKCCLSKVRSGELERLTHSKGRQDVST